MTLARLLRDRSRLSSRGESGDWRGLEVVDEVRSPKVTSFTALPT
jgi:hypothetical protein